MDQRAIIAFADWLKQAHGYASAELLHESWSTLARQAIGADGSVLTVRSSAGQLVVHRQGAVAADDDIARTAQLIDADSNAAAESWVSDAAAGSRFFVACPLVQGHAAGVVHRIEKPFHAAELDGCEAVFGALAAALLHRRQIDGLRARLEESERMLSETVHEMRSPLQAVLALAELLKSRETGFNADLSGKIVKNALLCRSILDDMKRASEGGEPLRRPTSLSELVGEALELRLPALLPTVSVRADLEDGEALVSVHPREIRQVILNLVNNAEQAMTEAGMRGEIIVRARVDRAAGKAVIVVADTGPGVPEHVRSKIFEPFFTTRQASGGTGLGLAMSQRIVRAHGGSLTLEPPPASGGAMFHPLTNGLGGGASDGLPRGAPASAQACSVAISAAVREASLEKGCEASAANHGGMVRRSTAARMARARGRACS